MRATIVAALLLVATQAAAQQPVFQSGVQLVRIPVSVTQGTSPVEPGVLTAGDFRVTEDGRPHQVAVFERESLPLSICVVFDTSGSMIEGPASELAIASLREMLTRLMPGDEVAIVAFAATAELVTPWTPAPQLIAAPITMTTSGSTSISDGVMKALEVVESARNPKRVILVITDGGENSSRTPLSRMVRTRRQSETQVFAFHVTPEVTRSNPRRSGMGGAGIDQMAPPEPRSASAYPMVLPLSPRMEDLVDDSGGAIFSLRTRGESATMAQAFVSDLRFQYTLGYEPLKAMDGKYRRVKVELRKRGYRIRHRGGYLALASEMAK